MLGRTNPSHIDENLREKKLFPEINDLADPSVIHPASLAIGRVSHEPQKKPLLVEAGRK
jgi:hypothetical protein